jgi:hypothetical protein
MALSRHPGFTTDAVPKSELIGVDLIGVWQNDCSREVVLHSAVSWRHWQARNEVDAAEKT